MNAVKFSFILEETITVTQTLLAKAFDNIDIKTEAFSSISKLIYYINKTNKIRQLCIFIAIIKNILNINYLIIKHLEFTRYYKRVSSLWYI